MPKGPYLIENEMGLEEGLLAELCVNRGRMIPSHQNHPVPNNPLATLPNTRTSSVFAYLLLVLGIESQAWGVLNVCSTTELCLSVPPSPMVFVRSNFFSFIKYLLHRYNALSSILNSRDSEVKQPLPHAFYIFLP